MTQSNIGDDPVDWLQILSKAKESLNICCDLGSRPELLTGKPYLQLFRNLHLRGVKQRFIFEISPNNLQAGKIITDYAEIRHLADFKGSFALVDGKGIATDFIDIFVDSQSAPSGTNLGAFLKHEEYVFETLWKKARPFQDRVREIEEGFPTENTEVVQGTENIVKSQIEGLAKTKKRLDACVDQTFPASLLSSKPVWDMCLELQERAAQIRVITEITPRNIEYCKQMMTRMELRHLNDIKGNFSISDKIEYRGAATMKEGEPPTQGILSTSKVFVDNQQYFFETLWNKALPAEQRFREIEEGIAPEIVEVISDGNKVQQFALNLVNMANRELLIMFASENEYRRQQQSPNGFLKALQKMSKKTKRGINIRITMPSRNTITKRKRKDPKEEGLPTFHDNDGHVSLRRFDATLSTRISIIIVDRKHALIVELGKNSEAIASKLSSGLAIYSNAKAIVLSYVSIFELLWTHIELYEEIRAREAAEREFIDIAAHELRGPIQPILGLAQEIEARQGEIGEGRLLGIILRSASNLQRLADNLLDVGRIENNRFTLSVTEFDLNELISFILADYAIDAARNKKVGMHFDPSQKTLLVRADKNRLYQVIANCVENSLKFTEEGSIIISSSKADGKVIVTIKDNGSGIDADILPKLFNKYSTSASGSGTGLGLFISKKIIEAHGGQITGENNKAQKGATFEFSIPLNSQVSTGS